MIPTFMDLRTGVTAMSPIDESAFWWIEGNGSCDCNRYQGFGLAMREEVHREFEGLCAGTQRFKAVDVDGDPEGETKEKLLAAMNKDYPI